MLRARPLRRVMTMKLIAWLLLSGLALGQGFSGTQTFRGGLQGTNADFPIRMTLTAKGNTLSGSYVYETRDQPLRLEGSWSGNRFTLREFDGGRNTGSFSGNIDVLSGVWTSADGKRRYDFYLVLQDLRFSQAALRTTVVADTKMKLSVRYPRFVANGPAWSKTNSLLAAEAVRWINEYRADYKEENPPPNSMGYLEMDYRVRLGQDSFLSVELIGSYCFPGGCANPYNWMSGVNIDPRSGQVIALSTFFKKGSKYLTELETLSEAQVIEELQLKGEDQQALRRALSTQEMGWSVDRGGFWLYFAMPSVWGDVQVAYIPFVQLRDYLDYSGVMGRIN